MDESRAILPEPERNQDRDVNEISQSAVPRSSNELFNTVAADHVNIVTTLSLRMVYQKRHALILNAEPPHTCYHSVFSAIFYRLARTLNGLSSAALKESNANRLTKYSAANLTNVSLSPPLPVSILCRPANGLSPTGRLGSEAEPSVRPLVEKTAEAAPGPEVSFAALRTAAVRAAGLAPRMVSTTEVDLMTRKVGILDSVYVSP